jgi:hypothetical protein
LLEAIPTRRVLRPVAPREKADIARVVNRPDVHGERRSLRCAKVFVIAKECMHGHHRVMAREPKDLTRPQLMRLLDLFERESELASNWPAKRIEFTRVQVEVTRLVAESER